MTEELSPRIGEDSPALGECSAIVEECSAKIEERSPRIGEGSPTIGERSSSVGERSAMIEEGSERGIESRVFHSSNIAASVGASNTRSAQRSSWSVVAWAKRCSTPSGSGPKRRFN